MHLQFITSLYDSSPQPPQHPPFFLTSPRLKTHVFYFKDLRFVHSYPMMHYKHVLCSIACKMLLKQLRIGGTSIEEPSNVNMLLVTQVVDHHVVELANNTLQLHLNNTIKNGGLICDKSCQCFNMCHNLLQCHNPWQLLVWVRVVLISLLKVSSILSLHINNFTYEF